MTTTMPVRSNPVGEQILDALADVPLSEAVAIVGLVLDYLRGTAMLRPPLRRWHERKGCPSEAQYRRHLAAGEDCGRCRRHVSAMRRAAKQRAALPAASTATSGGA